MRTGAGIVLVFLAVSAVAGCYEANDAEIRPGITVSPTSGLTTTEGGIQASFTVVLDTQPAADVVIDLSSSNTNEGTVLPAQLTFTAANWNQPQTVTVTGVNDTPPAVDGNVAYAIVTAAAVSADAGYNGMDAADVSVTNLDDDTAAVTVAPTSVQTTEQGNGTATFTVVLDTCPSGDVTVSLTVPQVTDANGARYEGLISEAGAPAATLDLTFTQGTWNAARTVTVTGQNEAFTDGNQTYTIGIAVSASADPNYASVDPADVSVTNLDNDSPGITVTPTSGLVTTESGGQATFTIVLNSQPSANVTIGLSSSNTGEGTVSTAAVTFTGVNWNQPQPVTVTGMEDAPPAADGNIAYTIVTAPDTTTADTNYINLDPADVSVTNMDNDGGQVWTKNATPVLSTGGADAWDEKYVQEPSVLMLGASSYMMWYEGQKFGQKHEQIGRATSPDGTAWTKDPAAAPVLIYSSSGFDKNGVGDPCMVLVGSTYMLWYGGRANAATKDKIGLATSADGIGNWTRNANPVLTGTAATWDATGVGSPHVIYDGSTYRLWYTGNIGGTRQIGYAASPDGVAWTKPSASPVLNVGGAGTFDSNGVMSCCVILDNGTYRMWYTGLNAAGMYRIGYATSPDGVTWTKYANNPVMVPGAAGTWDAAGVLMPWVIKDGATLRMWYTGLNAAGTYQIGYATAPEP